MIITVDTGGTKTLVASFDEEKNPKHIIKFPTPKNVNQYIQRVADQIHLIANDKPIDAISVALPGVVKDGVAVWCQNFGWNNQPIRELFSEHFPIATNIYRQ
ncbi:ROK family protein [Candidatus Minimicrobia naudis]|uniref:ROK family protein n=1 Tax=Candidatus Minimicrobia naudis TaxID=2841263 RepID=A0A8F1MCK9_9BACT|nr:ROK family protein [Candidatus Minimicrobia naudis]